MERLSEQLKNVLDDCINSISPIQQEVVDKAEMFLERVEGILGDNYDLNRLQELMNQRMSMREDVAYRMKLVGSIPLDRLRELVEADQDGRCVVLPKGYNGELFRVWKNQILSTEKFEWIMKKLGESFFPTFEAAEAALEAARESQE